MAHTTHAAEIEDHMSQRWFEIEIIIFERLDVLDVNVDETLTLNKRRSWPNNLLEVADAAPPSSDQLAIGSIDELIQPSPFCLGFPLLREQDPVHPLLDRNARGARNEFGDFAEQTPPVESSIAETDLTAIDATGVTANEPLPANAPIVAPTPLERVIEQIKTYEESLFTSSYVWLPNQALVDDVKSINRQRTLRPIIHRRWRQPVPPRRAPQPIFISAPIDQRNPATATGFARIEGFIDVTVSRYLHFAGTLWYHADTLGHAPEFLPLMPGSLSRHSQTTAEPYMQLQESRRMRSGDLHYLDHPKFGVIVKIDALEAPEELVAAWQAVQDSNRESM
jgi:hypothetical protein